MSRWDDGGWETDAPVVKQPKGYGRGYCGRCQTYHTVETGCADDPDEDRDDY